MRPLPKQSNPEKPLASLLCLIQAGKTPRRFNMKTRKKALILLFLAMIFTGLAYAGTGPLKISINANGNYGHVTIRPGDELNIAYDLIPGSQTGTEADFWAAAATDCCGIFWLDQSGQWHPSLSPIPFGRTGLFDVYSSRLLSIEKMPQGSFWFYVGVDLRPDSLLSMDSLFYDYVEVEATDDPSAHALQHLREKMDEYHKSFIVYTDRNEPGNHFVTYAKMGNGVAIIPSSKEEPRSGTTCIENRFSGTGWGGWYFMNGILQGEEVQPKANWGQHENAGIDLTGARRLSFWARGKNGGERVEFFAFGVGRDPFSGAPLAPFPDSSPKVTLCGLLASPCYVTLSREWRRYEIDLTGLDLGYVLGGFGWITNDVNNNGREIVFYLDDIKFDKTHLDSPRFIRSYVLKEDDSDELRNTSFVYDDVLALLAFLASNDIPDLERARLIGQAISYAMDHDRYFDDGRLRNAYQAGDLWLPDGWNPHGRPNTVRLPGWWDQNTQIWYEDKYSVSTHTGNMAWAIIGLLSLYEKTGQETWLTHAIRLGNWIEANCKDHSGPGGYTGGYQGWEATENNPSGQTKLTWKSTEHNIDIYVAFSRLYSHTGEDKWKNGAEHALRFVKAMWNEQEGHFWTGTGADGVTINKDSVPVDIQAWAVMAIGPEYARGLQWAEMHCRLDDNGFTGFDFNNDRDGVWFEGTAHMALAYKIAGDHEKAAFYLTQLEKAQREAPNGDSKGIVAASSDNVSTGFDWRYNARLHIGATAWFIFAERGYNPYWNRFTSEQGTR